LLTGASGHGTDDDLHAADGDWPVKPTPPFFPGHEGAGTFAEYAIGSAAYVVRLPE
jgi:D-arabinose 1-dehydrogenase-like Zn-dependent alcohol dehydrogenase